MFKPRFCVKVRNFHNGGKLSFSRKNGKQKYSPSVNKNAGKILKKRFRKKSLNEMRCLSFISAKSCDEIKNPLRTKNRSTPVQPNLAKPGSQSGCPPLKM